MPIIRTFVELTAPLFKIVAAIALAIILYAITFNQAYAYNNTIDALEWNIKKSTSEIEVFSAKVPQSEYKAVLSITTINKPISQVIALVRDVAQCSQWVYRCKHSKKHLTLSDNKHYVYTATNLPFPVIDRDILAYVEWEENTDNNTVTSTGVATNGVLPKKSDYVRLQEATMIWEFTALNNDQTKIRNFAHINPAGNIPSWLSNSLLVDAPFETMTGLREILGEETVEVLDEDDN